MLQEGIEGALQSLFREGVYLTVDEFKVGGSSCGGARLISAARLVRDPLFAAPLAHRIEDGFEVISLAALVVPEIEPKALSRSWRNKAPV